MKNGKLVPELRFPEFQEKWKEKKTVEIAPLQRGFDLPISEVQKGKYPVIYSNGILRYHNKYKAIGPGVITGRSGTIGKVTFVKDDYWPHNTSLWVTDFKNNSPKFIYYFYTIFQFDKFNAGSTVPTLNRNDIHDVIRSIPSFPEQTKIANFLTSVDKRIKLLSRRKEKLELYKKGVMQKIFSREIRFKDDYGREFPEWEEKSLGEILSFGSGKDYKHLKEGKIPVYGTGGLMTFVDDFLYDGESVGIGRKGTIDKPVYLSGKFWTVDTLFFTHSYKTIIPHFVFLIFQRINWMKFNEASGVPSLSKATLKKIKINVPHLTEQQKIASFLSAIDKKIEQVNRQLKQNRQWKKGLLQKMFV